MEAATDGWRMGGDVGWRLTRDGEFDGNPYAYLKLGLTLSLSLEYGLTVYYVWNPLLPLITAVHAKRAISMRILGAALFGLKHGAY